MASGDTVNGNKPTNDWDVSSSDDDSSVQIKPPRPRRQDSDHETGGGHTGGAGRRSNSLSRAKVYRQVSDVPAENLAEIEAAQKHTEEMNAMYRQRRKHTPAARGQFRARSKSVEQQDNGYEDYDGRESDDNRVQPRGRQSRTRQSRAERDLNTAYNPHKGRNYQNQQPSQQYPSPQHYQPPARRNHTPARRRSVSRGRGYESDGGLSQASGVSYRSIATGAKRIRPRISEEHRRPPANIIGYYGIYVLHLKSGLNEEDLRDLFKEFGRIYNITFSSSRTAARLLFDNPESPSLAIGQYNGLHVESICADHRRLLMRFCPGYNQTRRLINYGRPWTSDECYHWRTNGCEQAIRRCKKKHLPMSRGIDYQPWMMERIRY